MEPWTFISIGKRKVPCSNLGGIWICISFFSIFSGCGEGRIYSKILGGWEFRAMIIWFKLKAMRIADFKFLYLKTVRITGFKYSYLTYCEDHGFQVVVFENCVYHRFHLFKMVNRRGGHFQKNPPYFSQKNQFLSQF